MLFRRLSGALREQNWLTAGVDILIVVVGIFLGLQADNWNNERKDRVLERQYLERLHADLLGTVEDNIGNRQWDQQRVDSQSVVLAALRSGSLPVSDRDAFARGLMYLGSHTPLQLRWSTVEELKSTGNIAILRDLELRRMIGETEAQFRWWQQAVMNDWSSVVDLRNDMRRNFEAINYGIHGSDATEIHYDFDALASDQEFLNAFSNIHAQSVMFLLIQERLFERVRSLQERVEFELGPE